MTPVLVDLPVGWKRGRVKDVASFSASTIDKKEHDGQIAVRLCNYVDVYYNDRITDDLNFMAATASANEIARFSVRAGDVAITKDSETATDIGIPAYVPEDLPGVVYGYHLYVLRARSDHSGRYLKWLFDSDLVRAELATRANGLTRVGLGQGALGSLPIPIPPVDEQRRIAEFLDRETAQIDELIDKQEQLISTLAERERARVDTAVRGQDDQRASRVDTYDPWFPEIPVGWSLTSLVRVTLERVDFRGATPTKTDEGTQLVTARNIRPGHIDYEISREYIDPDMYDSVMRRGKPSVGDVLLTMEAPLGNVALVDREDVAFAQRVVMFRLDRQKLEPAFAVHALNADRFQAQLLSLATGSTALGLKASKLIELKLPLPPIELQTEIARVLDEHSRVSEELRLKCSETIVALRERRQALISAAVTGQIDVGGTS